MALLALVAGQDVEPVEGSDGTDGRWRIARRVAPDRVISTVDPDARHAHKTALPPPGRVQGPPRGRTGHRADHRLPADQGQPAPEPPPTPTLGAEPARRRTDTGEPAGAGAGRLRLRHRRRCSPRWPTAGHDAMIKPWPLRPPVPGGFTIDDFTVDEAAGTVTCPAGHTRPITRSRQVDLRRRLPRLPAARPVHHQPHRPQRCNSATTTRCCAPTARRAADPDFHAVYRQHRPMVERSIAWLTRGNRRLRYRGITKNNTWLHHRAAALNLRRLLALGLTRDQATWTLA